MQGISHKISVLDSSASYLCIIFGLATLGVFLLTLLGNSKNFKIKVLYEVFTIIFVVLNVIKYIAIVVVFTYVFSDEDILEQEMANHTVMLMLSSAYFFINFLALFCIRPASFCCNFHKHIASFLLFILLSNTFFYILKIYLITNYHDVSWGSRTDPLKSERRIKWKYICQNAILFLFWLGAHLFILYLYFLSPDRFLVLLIVGFTLLAWNLIRIFESNIYWHCKFRCSLKHKIYGQFRHIR